jgi:imidazoleglycerol-phosphate dehydratase
MARTAVIKRETRETSIVLRLDVDGTGQSEITSGVRIFDHLLSQLARHGLFDINISATGDDVHHLVEDVALCLGKAFNEALGEKRGLTRMADSSVPMDDALAMVAVDISGRGYSVLDLNFTDNDMFGFPTDLVRHFLETFAKEARLNLHVRILYGDNDHHKAESIFKAMAKALDKATRLDERLRESLPSTKEWIDE